MSASDTIPLSVHEIDAAAEVLVLSFSADPGLIFVLPDINERTRLNSQLAKAMLRFVLRCGAPIVTTAPVRGVALWFPPDAPAATDIDFLESGLTHLPTLVGAEAMVRFKRLIGQLEILHTRYAPEPHWYLAMLGVHPDWQRQGLGDALMQQVFRVADRDGIPCYLESPTLENTRYYQRRGFHVVGEIDVSDSAVHVWCLKRESRRKELR
jgi:ribosomal protein S18 acetylase RimI-like enzyme